MNRVLLIIGGLLVGLLAALFIVPVFVDWTRYRGMFEEEASRLVGRDVRVGGKVNLRLLPSPYIRFERVRVADTRATVGEPLFKAEDFTVRLAIGPLFRGDFEASVIELHKPVLTLVLDDKGGGNWASLADTAVPSAFKPSKVALNNIRINNGTIAVFGQGGDERTRVEFINGEVSSPAIDGPYRVTAAFASNGAAREIRLSTAKQESDGSIRLKGSVRSPATGSSFVIDGKLTDLFKQPHLQGELTAKLPLPSAVAEAAGTDVQRAPPAGTADASFELRTPITADTTGAEFADIALSFEQNGQPQLATGKGRIAWRDRLTSNVQLASRWLDLDRVTGRDDKSRLPELLERFLKGLDHVMPATGQSTIKAELDQATFGGDIISGLSVVCERKDSQLNIQASAAIPGGGRFDVHGRVDAASRDKLFDGELSLRGSSANRFLAWSGRNFAVPPMKRDGPFALSGRATLGPDRLAGRDLVVQFAGNSVTGEASWSGGSDRQIVLAIEGSELDLTPFVEADSGPLAALKAIAARLVETAPATAAPGSTAGALAQNLVARLRIGQLMAGRNMLRDVTADLRFVGGNLTVPLLRLGSDGWTAEVRGDIAGLTKPGAKGSLSWNVSAETPQGLQELLAAGEFALSLRPSPRRAAAQVPLRMAGRLRVGDAVAGVYDLTFDGNLGQTRAAGTVRLDPKGDGWRDWRTDVAVRLDGADANRLMEQIAPEGWSPLPGASSTSTGKLILRAIGTPKTGLASLASFETADLASEYRGKLSMTDSATLGIDGDLRLTTTDANQAMALLGIRDRLAFAGRPLSGIVTIAGSAPRFKIASPRIGIGSTTLSGRLDLELSATGNRLTGQIATSELSLPAVLALLTSQRTTQTKSASASSQASAWSEDTLDLAAFGALESRLRIDTASLELAPTIAVGKSIVEADLKSGRLDLKLVEATALGGKLIGALQIDPAASGATAKAQAQLSGGRLDALAPNVSTAPGSKPVLPAASGSFALQLDLAGNASTPRNLITSLRGKGELAIAQAKINRLAPRRVREIMDSVFAIKGEVAEVELGNRLVLALGGGEVQLGQRSLSLDVADGVIRIAPLIAETPEGRLTGTTLLDLEAMRFDSEWRIDVKAQAPAQPFLPGVKVRDPLPGIAVIYTGPISGIGSVDPSLRFEALHREIAVRKVERELEELERLRKQDAERRRQLEAAQSAQGGQPATPPPADPAAAPASTASPQPPQVPVPPAPQAAPPPPAMPPLVEPPRPVPRPQESKSGAVDPAFAPNPARPVPAASEQPVQATGTSPAPVFIAPFNAALEQPAAIEPALQPALKRQAVRPATKQPPSQQAFPPNAGN